MSSRANQKQANRMVREQLARERARTRRMWVSIGAAVLLVIAGLAGWAVYSSQRSDSFNTPAHATAGGDGLVIGSGPATVDVYLDFMCPHCTEFEDSAGGTLDQFSTTQYSTRSSAASGCASDAGKLADYVKVLYANQPPENSPGLTDDEIIRLAGTVGVSGSGFSNCVHDGKYKSWVTHVTDKATERGVNGTPTVYVNGKHVDATAEAVTAAVGS